MLVCLACYGDRVAALLESATELRFYDEAPGSATPRMRRQGAVPVTAQGGDGSLARIIDLLNASGAEVLLCGGLTCCALESLRTVRVHVVPWIGGAAEEVAQAWRSDRIQTMKMPGCAGCGQRRRRRRQANMRRRNMEQGKIAVTSEGPQLTDMVDPRFGRAAGFVVIDLATGQTSYVDNGGAQILAQGAGIQAAENVARAGAGTVLSGFVGPKAFQALAAAGIRVVQDVEGMTVGQAVEKYRRGEFAVAEAPNAQSGGRH